MVHELCVYKHQNLNAEDQMAFLSLFFNNSGCVYTCLLLRDQKRIAEDINLWL